MSNDAHESTAVADGDLATNETGPPTLSAATPKERRRAIASSFLGATVEYYDFLLYGAAAGLVFPQLFFQGLDPAVGTLLAYLTLFTGYVSRPIGGLLFGHFGDKLGRKNMLIITMLVMGLVSMGVGLMPTAHTIGVAAPIMLALLRVLQGIAVGGEWAGALLMSMEHSTSKSKGLGASFAMAGGPSGSVLATLVLGLFALLPDDQFLSWGWRVPFLLSALIVVFGLWLRANVSESPEFIAAKEAGELHTGLPAVTLLTKYWKQVLLGSLAISASLFVQGLLAVFMVPYVVSTGTMDRGTALMALTASSALHVFTIPFFAWLSDRFGRKQVVISGGIVSILLIFPMFWLFNSGVPALIWAAFLVGNPLIQACMYGPMGAYLSELFDVNSRYSGVSATYQLGAVIGAGLAPVVASQLVTADAGTTNLAWYMIAMYVVSTVAVLLTRAGRTRQQSHSKRFEESHRFEG